MRQVGMILFCRVGDEADILVKAMSLYNQWEKDGGEREELKINIRPG